MNWNRLQTGCDISVQLILVISLLTVTVYQFLNLKEEITNAQFSYNNGKQILELPSFTFCPRYDSGTYNVENMTFQKYMDHFKFLVDKNTSGLFHKASQSVFLTGYR